MVKNCLVKEHPRCAMLLDLAQVQYPIIEHEKGFAYLDRRGTEQLGC